MDKLIEKLSELVDYKKRCAYTAPDINKAINDVLVSREAGRKAGRRFSPGGSVCTRFKAYERLNDFVPRMAPADVAALRLFESGNNAHKTVQQNLLAKTGKLFGTWRCRTCHREVKNSVYPDYTCPSTITVTDAEGRSTTQRCADMTHRDENAWTYVERYVYSNPLDDDAYAITGLVDGIWCDKLWYTLEIKSVTADAFGATYTTKHPTEESWRIIKTTTSRLPVASHIYQGHVYSKMLLDESLAGVLPLPASDFGGLIILYVERDTFATKVYHEPYTASAYEQLHQQALTAKNAVASGSFMLAPPKCTSATNVLALRCPLKDTCFPKK